MKKKRIEGVYPGVSDMTAREVLWNRYYKEYRDQGASDDVRKLLTLRRAQNESYFEKAERQKKSVDALGKGVFCTTLCALIVEFYADIFMDIGLQYSLGSMALTGAVCVGGMYYSDRKYNRISRLERDREIEENVLLDLADMLERCENNSELVLRSRVENRAWRSESGEVLCSDLEQAIAQYRASTQQGGVVLLDSHRDEAKVDAAAREPTGEVLANDELPVISVSGHAHHNSDKTGHNCQNCPNKSCSHRDHGMEHA